MIKRLHINIDGIEVIAFDGQTILDVARENDINIPTLCYDERTTVYGACGLCVVEVEGNPKLVKACATSAADGMVIFTNTHRVRESRRTNLELLLSNHIGDCKAPCSRACPAGTDCQGYVGLIANGAYREAIALIKDIIPIPASIGRVCPHPCETDCRRGLVEESISIAAQKRFAADHDLHSDNPYLPEIGEATGKSVAVVGGGPYGITMAYNLRRFGHDVTHYDAMPKLGGMLRYGIPEYRLPKAVLDSEIELLKAMGIQIITGVKIGSELTLNALRKTFDAVALGIGAWKSTGVGCPGEDADGVIGGIDMLRSVVTGSKLNLGKRVAVVGGGNTAMDACRTAVRLGADNVYNIYRRTKNEMPADQIEIEEAEEEGVIFKNLTNPLEILKDENGHVKSIVLQIMELGEPDASGRRAPVAVPGKTETIEVDSVVLAIGQAVRADGFDGVDKTRKGGFIYDKSTFVTNIPGVFAGGDCGNDKVSIAIEAIADAHKSAAIVDAYLHGETISYSPPYRVVRDDITERTFEDRERLCRPKPAQLSASERRGNFAEVVETLTPEQAAGDASRCLECGCRDCYECKLLEYANEYGVQPSRFAGEKHKVEYDDQHPFIVRDPNKCVLCGLCVRVCDQVMGVGALGLVRRGFDVIVKPALERDLSKSGCIACGQCVSVCPTGALMERSSLKKPVPLATKSTETTCAFCSIGCTLRLETHGSVLVKSVPEKSGAVNHGLACNRGRFGFDAVRRGDILNSALIKGHPASAYDAFIATVRGAESVAARYGKESVAVAVSDRLSNEEAYAAKRFADVIGVKTICLNYRKNGLQPVLGFDASPNTFDELLSADFIIALAFDFYYSPVLRYKMKNAKSRGAAVYLVTTESTEPSYRTDFDTIIVPNDLSFLRGFCKSLIDSGKANTGLAGYDLFVKSLSEVKYDETTAKLAEDYKSAKTAMFVVQQNILSIEAATLIADAALLTGHIGKPRSGIVLVRPKNNTQGLIDLGIISDNNNMDGIKALISFCEDPQDLPELEFLSVIDTHLTETAKKANVVIPGSVFDSLEGTYTNSERRLQTVHAAVEPSCEYTNWEIAAKLAYIAETDFGWEDTADISAEMDEKCETYRNSVPGVTRGGTLKPVDPKLVVVTEDHPLVDTASSTDALMKSVDDLRQSIAPKKNLA